jgi:hypothetical protein
VRKRAALLAVGMALCGLVASASSAQESTRKPALKIVAMAPLTVQGTGFRGRERVRVIAVASSRQVRRLRASTGGRFTAGFPDVAVDRCGGSLTVTAQGRAGSFARTKILQEFDCRPGLDP